MYLCEKHVRLASSPRLPVASVVDVRAGDGRMEEECDDDPFDDPFGDALHVSSGLQETRDSSAVGDETVGLGAAFDNVSVKSRWAQMTAELTQLALDPEFTFEPDEAAHITDALDKLQRFMHNLKTHREMSQNMSKNSKMDGDGVIGMSNLVAIPMRGAAGDTALSRKRGWHEKMVDEHKRKASKGEQISISKYLVDVVESNF